MDSSVRNILDQIKSRKPLSDGDIARIEAEIDTPKDAIRLRGCLEIALMNALTGKEIFRSKKENAMLYSGRSWLMQKIASAGMDSTETIAAALVIGTDSTATAYTHTGPQGYFTFKAGTLNLTTQSGGTGVPVMQVLASWESTELTDTGFNSIWEVLLHNSTGSTGTYLNRYVSGTFINATTSNQLLITYTVSF